MGCGASSSAKTQDANAVPAAEETKVVGEGAPGVAETGDNGANDGMRASVSNYVQGLASAAAGEDTAAAAAGDAPVVNVEEVPTVEVHDTKENGNGENDSPEESKPEETAPVEDEEGPRDPAPSAEASPPPEVNEETPAVEEGPVEETKASEEEQPAAAAEANEPAPAEGAEEAAAAAPTGDAPEVVQLYVGDEDSSVMTGQDSVCLGKGCKVEEFMVWNVADCVEEDAIEVYSKPVPKLLHTSKWWLGAAFLSSCSVKLRTAPLATSMKFVGGALSVATPIVLVQQASIVPTIPPLSLSAIYWNLPTVGAALHWLSAAVTVPNMVMAATAYIMVKASIGFLRRGKSVPVGSGRPIYYIAAAVTATTACGYLGQLFSLFPVFTGTSLFGHHMVSLIPVKYAEWFTSSSLMLVNAGFMSGAGLKAVVPAIVANAIWVGGELGSVFLTSPLWAKVGLYSMSLGLGVVPLIWYIGYRLRDISKSYGDRELAGRFRLIADLTVVTWSLYPLAWLLSDGLGLMNMTSSSYVIMMSGLDILSKYGSGVLATKDHQVLSRAYSIATGDSGGKNRTRRVDPVPEGSVTEQAVYTETPPLLGEMATAALQSEGQAGDRSESSDDAIEEEE